MIWVEIHCDAKLPGLDLDILTPTHLCYTTRGEPVAQMSGNRLQDLSKSLQDLDKHARNHGWIKSNGYWCCPGCVKTKRGLPKINALPKR